MYFQTNQIDPEIFSDEICFMSNHPNFARDLWPKIKLILWRGEVLWVFQETVLSLQAEVHSNKVCDFSLKKKLLLHLEMDGLCKALTFSLTATNGLLFMICFYNPIHVAR